jgi:hypothetical protein
VHVHGSPGRDPPELMAVLHEFEENEVDVEVIG